MTVVLMRYVGSQWLVQVGLRPQATEGREEHSKMPTQGRGSCRAHSPLEA